MWLETQFYGFAKRNKTRLIQESKLIENCASLCQPKMLDSFGTGNKVEGQQNFQHLKQTKYLFIKIKSFHKGKSSSDI